jgi:hypothetical protein
MDTSLAKRPANFMRETTRAVRDHAAAHARITDQYFAKLKRAEAEYFDAVKRITDAITSETEPAEAPVAADAPVAAEAAEGQQVA